jgi:hypothetical protein
VVGVILARSVIYLRTKPFICALIAAIFLLSNLSFAWGPHTHVLLTKTVMDKQNTRVAQLCKNHEAQLYAGLMVPDITVLEYFKNYPVGKNYRLTHNWNFEQRLFEQAGDVIEYKCFAYGASTHNIQDTISHNYFVVEKILEYFVPNWLIHPIVEGIVEAHVIVNHPEITYMTAHSMDMLFEEGNEEYLEMVQNAIGPATVFDVRTKSYELSTMLGSFYQDAFSPKKENIFYTLWNVLARPIAAVTTVDDAEIWLDLSSDYTESVFNNWNLRLDLTVTPHGSERLAEADKFPILLWLAIPILFLIALYLYVIRRLKFVRRIESNIIGIFKKIIKRG